MTKTTNQDWELILETSRLMHDFCTKEHASDPRIISIAQGRILQLLLTSDRSVSLKELATDLNLTPPTTSTTVDSMVKQGLLCRVANKNDRRAVNISLTKNGREIQKRHEKFFVELIENSLSDISSEQRQAFHNVLQNIHDKLNSKLEK